MKLIHLSDLHLGKRVNGFSMIPDQKFVLEQILDMAREEMPDGALLCGDIYDKTVPSAEAVELFDAFLSGLAEICPVYIISGNHDSAERLAFGGRLLKKARVFVSPVYGRELVRAEQDDEFGTVVFHLLPFVKPAHVKRFFPKETVESYTDGCRVAIRHMNLDTAQRNVLLSHQFVTGAQRCESEDISVGGSDNVDASVFGDFDYVALGHIHSPQNITGHIRYCGTPLKYSFSEANHQKSITVVELGGKGEISVRTIPLTPLHDLRQIKGTYLELTDRQNYQSTATDDYLHIILTDEEDVPEAMGRLRVIYPNLMKLTYDNTRTRSNAVLEAAEDIQHRSPLELFSMLYELQNNQPMTDTQRQYVQNLIEHIQEEQL